jgi:hypothetical protein
MAIPIPAGRYRDLLLYIYRNGTDMKTRTLWCRTGHDWSAPLQRGRKPHWCPEHREERVVTERQAAYQPTEQQPAESEPKRLEMTDAADPTGDRMQRLTDQLRALELKEREPIRTFSYRGKPYSMWD